MSGRLRVGITTMAVDAPARFRELVEVVEAAGFDEFWLADSSLHARDAYPYLTIAATASHRLRIGPNCTHPYTRHPAVTANAMATLSEISGGRAAITIGAGDRPVTELGYGTAPVDTLREMVGVVRALTAGGTLTSEAPIALHQARLAFPSTSPVPIYLAASGPRMLELGGEIGDGVFFLSGVHPACVDHALAHVRAGVARAGRGPEAVDIACTVVGSLRDDIAHARRECVPLAAWFPQTAPVYAELAGVPSATTEAIRTAYSGGHFDAARRAFAHVTDAMVDAFTIAGSAELWVDRLSALLARGVRHLNVFLLSADRHAMVRALGDKVLPHLRGA